MAKSKRLKKKQQKTQAQNLLIKAGYSKKEQKRMDPTIRQKETTRLIRNEKQRTRRENNRKNLLRDGIPLSIITAERLDSKSYNNLTQKQKSELKRRGEKLDQLKAAGYSYSQVKGDLRLGWDKLNAKYGGQLTPPDRHRTRGTEGNRTKPKKAPFNPQVRMTGKHYLYIGAAEVQGGFSMDDLSEVSDDRLIELINERVQGASADPDGSEDLYCVFKVHIGSRSDCETMARFYYKRGYNLNPDHLKLDQNRYHRITVSNTFSQREFHEMVYTCISQMKNDDVPPFMDQMTKFCRLNGFPFMKNLK